MPGHGNEKHDYLKAKAMEQAIRIYGAKIIGLKHEQPSGTGQNYYKVEIKLGVQKENGIVIDYTGSVMIFPDLQFRIKLSDKEKHIIVNERKKLLNSLDPKERYGMSEYDALPDERLLIIECETSRSGLVTGKLSRRHHSYHVLKMSNPEALTLILVTFNNIDTETDLFDVIWKFPLPESI